MIVLRGCRAAWLGQCLVLAGVLGAGCAGTNQEESTGATEMEIRWSHGHAEQHRDDRGHTHWGHEHHPGCGHDRDGGAVDAGDAVDVLDSEDAGDTSRDDALEDAASDEKANECDASRCDASCVDLGTSVEHCGSCDNDCTSLPGVDPTKVRCVSGQCDVTGACALDRAHCSADAGAGCETDITTAANCGACNLSCGEPTPSCTREPGAMFLCTSGCSSPTPTRCDGTCVDLLTDRSNCGSCGNSCAITPGLTSCAGGTCTVPSCEAGFADCDQQASNGCETDLRTSAQSCGACGHFCPSNQVCTGSTCTTCALGSFKCETTMTCVTHCSQQCSNEQRIYANCWETGMCVSGAGGFSDSCAFCPSHHVCQGPTQLTCVPACGFPNCAGTFCI